jgi:hypothetical protein
VLFQGGLLISSVKYGRHKDGFVIPLTTIAGTNAFIAIIYLAAQRFEILSSMKSSVTILKHQPFRYAVN